MSVANSGSRETSQRLASAKSGTSGNSAKLRKSNIDNADALFDAKWVHFLKYCEQFFVEGNKISSPCTIQMSENMMRFVRRVLGHRPFFHKRHLMVFVVIFQLVHKFVDGYDVDYELTYPHWYQILENEAASKPLTLKLADAKVYEQKTFCKLCKQIEVLFIDTIKWDIGQFFDANWCGDGKTKETDETEETEQTEQTEETQLAIATSRLTLGCTHSKRCVAARIQPRAPCSTPCSQVSIPNALNATIPEAGGSKFVTPVTSKVDTAPTTPESPEISCGNFKRKRIFDGVDSVERTAFVAKIS